MSKIVNVEYIYKKDKKINESIYIFSFFLLLLLILSFILIYRINF